MHQRNLLGLDQLAEFRVEIGKVGVVGDGVSGFVVTLVPLVLPNVHCKGRRLAESCDESKARAELSLPKVSQSPTSVRQLPTR